MNKLQQAQDHAAKAQQLAKAAEDDGNRKLSAAEWADFQHHRDEALRLKSEHDNRNNSAKVAEGQAMLKELAENDGDAPQEELAVFDSNSSATAVSGSGRKAATFATPEIWAKTAASALHKPAAAGGRKSLVSGSWSLPTVMVGSVVMPEQATEVLNLIPKFQLGANDYAYLRQTARTNNAKPVADGETKPTSTITFEEVKNRARVVAHLSEPFPQRFLLDQGGAVQMLRDELANGVVQAIEEQVLNGDPSGDNDEDFTGIFKTTGVTDVAYSTDVPTTLRKARTALQKKDEKPNAWVFSPDDAEALDLLREDGTSGDFLDISRILGPIPFVVSHRLSSGEALLADWQQCGLAVRQDMQLDVNAGGDELFKKNQVMLRAEERVAFEIYRPQAFAVVHLTTSG